MLHTVKVRAVIDASQQLHLQLPPDTPLGDAEVIVMVTPTPMAANATSIASLRQFFADLDARPLAQPRSADEIEAQIAEERSSWD